MKTKNFWSSIATVVIMTVLTVFASCNIMGEDEEEQEDYLVSSRVVNEGCSILEQNDVSAVCNSWIEVEQNWSISGTKTLRFEARLQNGMERSVKVYTMNVPDKWDWMDPIKIVFDSDSSKLVDTRLEGGLKVCSYRLIRNMSIGVRSTNELLVETYTSFCYEKAVYTDEKLTYEMPAFEYKNDEYVFDFDGTKWFERQGVWYNPIKIVTSAEFADVVYSWEYTDHFVYQP
ncbi:MAG: hypothetical protein IJ529_01630 [Alphaproteobacteria bacterium]|nr:hypothetical protein [Alphaproteobacteria bacterium]